MARGSARGVEERCRKREGRRTFSGRRSGCCSSERREGQLECFIFVIEMDEERTEGIFGSSSSDGEIGLGCRDGEGERGDSVVVVEAFEDSDLGLTEGSSLDGKSLVGESSGSFMSGCIERKFQRVRQVRRVDSPISNATRLTSSSSLESSSLLSSGSGEGVLDD